MSKFDTLISTKIGQLNEFLSPGQTAQPGAQPGAQPAAPTTQPGAQPNTQPATNTAPTAQQTDPAQALAQAFKGIKFTDPNMSVQALNNAMKTIGNTPGIKEFFGSLAFDPQKGFSVAQQKQTQAPQAQAQAPGTVPLR